MGVRENEQAEKLVVSGSTQPVLCAGEMLLKNSVERSSKLCYACAEVLFGTQRDSRWFLFLFIILG